MRLDGVLVAALALYAATCFFFVTMVYPNLGGSSSSEPDAAEAVDLYSVLELERGEASSDTEVKRQFRSLSRKFHPDVNSDPAAKDRFRLISRAYEVLGDRKKRKIYDLRGEEGLQQLEQAEKERGRNFNDPFAAMFGMHGPSSKAREMHLRLQLPLEDFFAGVTHEISIQKNKLCRRCKGTGAKSPRHVAVCPYCKGHGVVVQRVQVAPGFVQQIQQHCPQCRGHGKIVTEACPACEGRVIVRGEATLEVTIEPGLAEGHQLVFDMEGDEAADLLPGDVVVTVTSKPHSVFRRDGNDLHMDLQITLVEAVVGFSRTLVHLDGHEFTVANAAVTPSGAILTIPEEGMPKLHIPSERGNLYVAITVLFPRGITASQAEALANVLGA